MNTRKSSLPISVDENTVLSKDICFKNLCLGDKTRLVSSCSKIDFREDITNLSSNKSRSFPASSVAIETFHNSSIESSKSDSSVSITATMLKVRRLTHVYDEDELIEQCKVSPALSAIELHHDSNDGKEDHDNLENITKEILKPSTKFGDRSYKLPSKAAAILGANDLLLHQFLYSDNAPVNSHALFLENKIQKTFHSDCESIDGSSKGSKSKRKAGLGSEVKEKIASLWKQSEQSPMAGFTSSSGGGSYNSASVTHSTGSASGLQLKDMEKLLRAGKATLEQIKNWSHSFESLLHDKFGLAHFHDFLRSEFSDENIEFWIACEEYRTITNNKKLQSRAEKIYNDYVGVQAAREVNLDSKTRQQTETDIHNPNPHTFDQAQKRIQALMEKDSYQRFLRSELYGRLLRTSEEYHMNQIKSTRDPCASHKGVTINNLEVTAQELSRLTMTTSKLALRPHANTMPSKVQCDEAIKVPMKIIKPPEREFSLIGIVQPDDPSLPFSKQSLLYTPHDMHK